MWLAGRWPASTWALVDRRRRAAAFVADAVRRLGWEGRVEVVEGRAEDVGRDPDHRRQAWLVVARGFGPPAVVAECAAPLLLVGGTLVVSEPPDSDGSRWEEGGLAAVGLVLGGVERSAGAGFAVLTQREACGGRYPRRHPAKRPLW